MPGNVYERDWVLDSVGVGYVDLYICKNSLSIYTLKFIYFVVYVRL